MAVPLVPGPGLGDANAAQKSMSTLLKNQCDFCAVLIEPKQRRSPPGGGGGPRGSQASGTRYRHPTRSRAEGESWQASSQATPGRSGRHRAGRVPGGVSAGQGRLPRLPAPVPGGSTGAGSPGPGHHGARLAGELGPPRAPGPALPPGLREARLPARCHPRPSRRPSVPTVPSWRKKACQLRICHTLPCFSPAREAAPTHPSA